VIAWVCMGVEVAWLAAVRGIPIREGRIGDERVFGAALPKGRWLIWATEDQIKKLVEGSAKGATAMILREARKEYGDVLGSLPAISGEDSESGVFADTKIEVKGEAVSLAADRQVGVESEGAKKSKPIVSKDAASVPPKETEEKP
jgi:hypothetical protein